MTLPLGSRNRIKTVEKLATLPFPFHPVPINRNSERMKSLIFKKSCDADNNFLEPQDFAGHRLAICFRWGYVGWRIYRLGIRMKKNPDSLL
jgi:hypothetical protein